MDSVVKKNVALMRSSHAFGMMGLLNSESMGGNAGRWEGLPCVGANFHLNAQTGEIIAFGNIQHLPRDIAALPHAVFKVAISMQPPHGTLIVDFRSDAELVAEARKKLEWTVKEYNQVYGMRGFRAA